jgi:glycerol-3-phosphate acyltransferase PlsY
MKWVRVLPLLYLLATFGHCYETFELYNGGLNFPKVTTVLLVLAIDSSIYFSMQVIELVSARTILILSGIVSVTLNVKYMADWKPDGTFWLIIGVVSGILIPLMLCLFGWLAKEVRQQSATGGTNGTLNLEDAILFYASRFPGKSDREITLRKESL